MLSTINKGLGMLNAWFANDGFTAEEIEAWADRNKLSNYLPYKAYDPADNYYICADDCCGLLWETTPLVYASATTHDNIEQIFKTVPMGTVVQSILFADKYIDNIIDSYVELRKDKQHQSTGSELMAMKTAEFFKEASEKGFSKIARTPARRFRGFFAVKLPMKDGFDDDTRYLRDSINEVLKGCGLMPRYMDPQELCSCLQRILNDTADVPGNWRYNEELPINKQIIMGGTRIKFGFNHIRIGTEKLVNVQSIKEYPAKSMDDLTLNEVMGGIWGPRDDGNQYNFPFMVSVNIVVEDFRQLFHGKTVMMMYQQKKGSSAGFKMDRQNELAWAAQETDRGERFLRVIPTIVSFADSEKQANENTARVKRLWENKGFDVNKDRGILGPLFLLSLPFGLYRTKNNIEFLERDRIMPSKSAARMLPLQGDFSGFGEPVTLLVGRKGQVLPVNLFNETAPNNNALISAGTGSGKSYLMNRILSDQLSTDVIVRAFDFGNSYKKLSKRHDGNFIYFGQESKICVNPYTNIRSINEEIGILSLNISQMVWSSSKGKPSETQMTILKTAARQVWDDYGNDGRIDYVKKVLIDFGACLTRQNIDLDSSCNGKIKDLATELAFNLSDFCGNGPYAHWFNGKSTLDMENDRFVVLELQELISMKELFNVVVMQIVNYVTQNLYLSDRSNPRTIVFDEAHKWFKKGSFLGDVVENGYRMARKYYGSFITIFQSMMDLQDFGKSGQVLNENSAWKFFLMSKSGYDIIKDLKLIDYDPFLMKMLNSIRLEKGLYSEIFIQTPGGAGAARLPSDPFSHLVFTSDPRENNVINQYAASKKISEMEAIAELASELN